MANPKEKPVEPEPAEQEVDADDKSDVAEGEKYDGGPIPKVEGSNE